MSKTTVNILSVINKSSKITKEIINNKEHYIIRDVVPVIDDVVMNNGLYPKDEIDKSYKSINGNLMPIGHPNINGQFVSASHAKAINEYYGGAWAENVRKEQDKVLLDCYVDIEFARNHEKGKQLLERLDAMFNGEDVSPIHISTGLILNKIYKTGKSKGKKYYWIATNMQFDHVAILLNEQGAATPDEGVGIFVNSEGEYQIEYASLNESSTQTIQNAISNAIHNALQIFKSNKQEEQDPMKEKILAALNAKGIKTDGLTDEELLAAFNEQTAKEAIDKKKAEDEEKDKDKDKKEKEKEGAQNQEQAPAWFKDFSKRFEAVEKVVKANVNNEEQAMRTAVKTKFGMSDTAVNALSGEPLKELYAQCQTSVGLNSATNQFNNDKSICDMPE